MRFGGMSFLAGVASLNTRAAYARAAARFSSWCEERALHLADLDSTVLRRYFNEAAGQLGPSSIRQHRSALIRLCDWFVADQVLISNPVRDVLVDGHTGGAARTAILADAQVGALYESIDTSHVVGLRDRAMIGTMIYAFAPVSDLVRLDVSDYGLEEQRRWLTFAGRKSWLRRVPVHPELAKLLDAYLEEAGLADAPDQPLFQSTRGRSRRLTGRRLGPREVLSMVKRHAKRAGIGVQICNRSLRATGLTAFLGQGGNITAAAAFAGCASVASLEAYAAVPPADHADIGRISLPRPQVSGTPSADSATALSLDANSPQPASCPSETVG